MRFSKHGCAWKASLVRIASFMICKYAQLCSYARSAEGNQNVIVKNQPLLILSDTIVQSLQREPTTSNYNSFVDEVLSPVFISPDVKLEGIDSDGTWRLTWTPPAERLLSVALYTLGYHARSADEILQAHFKGLGHSSTFIQQKLRTELAGPGPASESLRKWQQDQVAPWSVQEDVALQLGVSKYGSYTTLSWHRVVTSTDMLDRRDPVSCCYRWFGVLLPKYSGKRQNALLSYKSYILGDAIIGQPRGPQGGVKRKLSEMECLQDGGALDSDSDSSTLQGTDT
ncbi:hypothetical protein FOL47_003257 [Perkinsus chesapeaki]|uniref:Myb-like domain-containing protein n=1 Tax=Perkinsus chesapeaki TaxID=330153 RepID=A0A7J6N2X1_PERCH|nr:hypothetical protein FOL47_003257 [Perkinsus chesapeaki]